MDYNPKRRRRDFWIGLFWHFALFGLLLILIFYVLRIWEKTKYFVFLVGQSLIKHWAVSHNEIKHHAVLCFGLYLCWLLVRCSFWSSVLAVIEVVHDRYNTLDSDNKQQRIKLSNSHAGYSRASRNKVNIEFIQLH